MYRLESDTDFFDDFCDISSGENRIVRIGTKPFEKTGNYITIELFNKTDEEVFKINQAVTLLRKEFDFLADKYSKVEKMIKPPTCETHSIWVYETHSNLIQDFLRFNFSDNRNSLKIIVG